MINEPCISRAPTVPCRDWHQPLLSIFDFAFAIGLWLFHICFFLFILDILAYTLHYKIRRNTILSTFFSIRRRCIQMRGIFAFFIYLSGKLAVEFYTMDFLK